MLYLYLSILTDFFLYAKKWLYDKENRIKRKVLILLKKRTDFKESIFKKAFRALMTKHFYVSIKEKPQGFYQETYCPRYRIATFASPILAFQDILCSKLKKK